MVILQKNLEGVVVGRTLEFPIAVFMFNSWDGVLDTVLVGKATTDNETELLRKIAYQYAEKIGKMGSGPFVRHEMFDVFQQSFDEYNMDPKKEFVDEFYFKKQRCKFIKNAYDSPQEVIDDIIRQVCDVSGISISIHMSNEEAIVERTIYTVSLPDVLDRKFTFWYSTPWPNDRMIDWNLHIVPDYHPSSPSQGGNPCAFLINGATDALIGSEVIGSVYSPEAARQQEEYSFSSWSAMQHPCKANGNSFQFTLSGFYHLTKELVDGSVGLILATLGVYPGGGYVGISGGFSPPYDFPENISNRTGKKLPCEGTPRGSEKHCMWMYDVLKEENELEKAFIPTWFIEENWVDFFKDSQWVFPSLIKRRRHCILHTAFLLIKNTAIAVNRLIRKAQDSNLRYLAVRTVSNGVL